MTHGLHRPGDREKGPGEKRKSPLGPQLPRLECVRRIESVGSHNVSVYPWAHSPFGVARAG